MPSVLRRFRKSNAWITSVDTVNIAGLANQKGRTTLGVHGKQGTDHTYSFFPVTVNPVR